MNPFEVLNKLKKLKDAGVEVVFSENLQDGKITVLLKQGLPQGVYIPLSVVPKILKVVNELKGENER